MRTEEIKIESMIRRRYEIEMLGFEVAKKWRGLRRHRCRLHLRRKIGRERLRWKRGGDRLWRQSDGKHLRRR